VELVRRGTIDTEDARELIAISPEQEADLQRRISTRQDAVLVQGAMALRREILRQSDLLSSPIDASLTPDGQATVSFLLEACERDERRRRARSAA
jgi:hypothetical protein